MRDAFAPVGAVTLGLVVLVMAGSDLGSALCLVLVAAAVLVAAGHARRACSGASPASRSAASS